MSGFSIKGGISIRKIILFLALVLLILLPGCKYKAVVELNNPQRYQVVYNCTIWNINYDLSNFWLYLPKIKDWKGQLGTREVSVTPGPMLINDIGWDDKGNYMYYWGVTTWPQGWQWAYTFEVVSEFTAFELNIIKDAEEYLEGFNAYDRESWLYQEYTKSEEFIQSDYYPIWKVADEVQKYKTTPYSQAASFYQFVTEHMDYELLGEGLKGAKYAYDEEKGECGDYAALFCALCRAAGIPARLVVGHWAASGNQTHVWAEFYVEPFTWIPVDPTVGDNPQNFSYYFGNMDNSRVIMTKGCNIKLDPQGPPCCEVAPILQVWHPIISGTGGWGDWNIQTQWTVRQI